MKHIYFTIIALVTFSAAQQTSPLLLSEQFYYFHSLTVDDGLSQNLVQFIHQDRQGFLWFGTAGGLDRYDGFEFKPYNTLQGLTKQPVYFFSCLENPDTTFWISTNLGLMLFNPVTHTAQMYAPPSITKYGDATSDIIYLTRLNNGTILCSVTGKGLFRFDETLRTFSLVYSLKSLKGNLPGEDIVGIVPFENDNVLVVTNEHLLNYNVLLEKIQPLSKFPVGVQATCVLFNDKKQEVLIGTTSGVALFRNNALTWNHTPFFQKLYHDSVVVRALFKDSKGTLWIGAEHELIALRDGEKEGVYYRSNPFNPSDSPASTVIAFFEDRAENLWMSTQDKGLCRIDLKKKKFFSITNRPGIPQQLSSELVRDICIDAQNRVWVAADGVTCIDFKKQQTSFYGLSSSNRMLARLRGARKIYAVNDSLLAILTSTPNGERKICLFNTTSFSVRELALNGVPLNGVYRALVRRTGNLLCVTPDSIFEIDPVRMRKRKTIIKIADQPFLSPTAIIDDVKEDALGNVWFGTTLGLLQYNESQSSFRFISNTTTSSPLLPDPCVLSLALSDKNVLWLGTISGLYKYDLQQRTMKGYHESDGLPNDKIWSIAVDRKKRIWATSNRGLMRLIESSDGTLAIRSFTIEDGLPSNEFNMTVVAEDANGRLFFGTPSGMVYFHPDSLEDNSHLPEVVLTDLKNYGVSELLDNEISFTTTLNIPFEKKVFSVRYAALDFTDPLRNRYAYKLEGYDERWVEAGKRREAFFTNLDPGTYTLLIKASNNDGVWNERPLAVQIVIAPPFWMTWWFRGIVIFIIVVGIGGGVRYVELKKIRRRIEMLEHQQALERERSRISKDMHDEVGASLTKIAILSELASRNAGETRTHLGKITETSREVIDSMSQIIWAINPKNDKLENLAAYLREFISETLEMTNIHGSISFPSSLPEQSLSAEFRRNIFLVVKEAVNNIVKYSNASEVKIELKMETNVLSFSITDNGIGFDVTNPSRFGNGLYNMKKRIEDIGGTFTIQSSVEKGTTVAFQVSINT